MSKKFIVGDIHGCYDELVELFEKLNVNKDEDSVIFVGDYFDRGPKSFEVWEFLCILSATMGDRCALLRGNHEVMLVDYLDWKDDTWILNGHRQTIESFQKHDIALLKIRDWIKENTSLYYVGESFDVVHAGRELDDLSVENPDVLIWDRSLFKGRDWEGKFTFIGHTAMQYNPVILSKDKKDVLEYEKEYDIPESGVIDLDTGCVYGNKLSAAEITEDNKIILHYVDSKQEKRF